MPRVSDTPPAGPDADGRVEGTPSTSSTASTANSIAPGAANGHRPQLQRLSRSSRFTTEAEHEPKQVWSFSSSGWLFVYHFGAVKALKHLGLESSCYSIGSSGGACAGGYLFLDADIDATVEYILKCAATARGSLRAALDIKTYVRGAIQNFAPSNIAEYLNGNFEVSVTEIPFLRNYRIRRFEGLADFTQGNRSYCIDGGFSDFQILKGMFLGRSFFSFHMGDAISVCPFYCSRADIAPSEYVPLHWAFYPPKDPEQLRRVYDLGYRDTLTWLKKHGQIPYGLMHPKQEAEEDRPQWWQVLQETAAAAPSCEEGFAELAQSATSWLRKAAACLVWLLIILELGLLAALTGFAVFISPVLPEVSTFETIRRFTHMAGAAASPWLILKALPGLRPSSKLSDHPRLAADLRNHSLIYRIFRFLLEP